MNKILLRSVSLFLIAWFPIFTVSTVYGQDDDIMSETYMYDDDEVEETESESPIEEPTEEEEADKPAEEVPVVIPPPVEKKVVTPKPKKEEKKEEKPAPEYKKPVIAPVIPSVKKDDKRSLVQNAVIEGIQLSSEPGDKENESIISCYFIFRDKPTSYFYENRVKDKVIVFEFNDVELGSSPISTASLPPIQKFTIRQEKIDANKDIVGLKPEWHDVVKVTFYVDDAPIISVKDEYSVISFSFKWSSDPEKNKDNIKDDGKPWPGLWWILGSTVVGGAGAAVYIILQPPDPDPVVPPTLIPIDDIPDRPDGY